MITTAISSHPMFVRQDAAPKIVGKRPVRMETANVACERGEAPGLHLTPRQLEVLYLLCEGLPNKLICRRLNISAGTVKVHIGCILRELGVASRLQAVVFAHGSGLVGDSMQSTSEDADSFEPAEPTLDGTDSFRRSAAHRFVASAA